MDQFLSNIIVFYWVGVFITFVFVAYRIFVTRKEHDNFKKEHLSDISEMFNYQIANLMLCMAIAIMISSSWLYLIYYFNFSEEED